MGKVLFDYQERAVTAVEREWSDGARSVCLVAPPGAGKTLLGATLAKGRRALWLAHRQELVDQAAAQLAELVGDSNVGLVMAGRWPNEAAPIQVGTIETVLRRERSRDVDLLVIDECHHIVADHYRTVLDRVRPARVLGMTPTPERSDGRPLGDVFERLVVAATYSQLIASGRLIGATVLRPVARVLRRKIASEPADAYVQHARGRNAFVFLPTIEDAERTAIRLRNRDVRAESVDGKMGDGRRADAVREFRANLLDVLTNVFLFTEGVDVPSLECVVLARAFDFVGTMLQATGRVLRSHPGKTSALVIDLSGCTNKHGLPHIDRDYSLSGRAITPAEATREREVEEVDRRVRVGSADMELVAPSGEVIEYIASVEGDAKPPIGGSRATALPRSRRRQTLSAAQMDDSYRRGIGWSGFGGTK